MRPRHPPVLPTLWLMTDERIADPLAAARRLPRGAGIVFRHHATPPAARRALFARLLRLARARGLVLVRAGPIPMRGEMGVHGPARAFARFRTAAVHDHREARAARRGGVALVFVSPVFATRSHPGAPALGPRRAARLARAARRPAIALGGLTPRRFRPLRPRGFAGWAAIDAWCES